jgi:hypothetical protein
MIVKDLTNWQRKLYWEDPKFHDSALARSLARPRYSISYIYRRYNSQLYHILPNFAISQRTKFCCEKNSRVLVNEKADNSKQTHTHKKEKKKAKISSKEADYNAKHSCFYSGAGVRENFVQN